MLNTAYEARTIATLPQKRASGDALYPTKVGDLYSAKAHILVPFSFSKRVLREYGVSASTPDQ